jgi:hypothetical protein
VILDEVADPFGNQPTYQRMEQLLLLGVVVQAGNWEFLRRLDTPKESERREHLQGAPGTRVAYVVGPCGYRGRLPTGQRGDFRPGTQITLANVDGGVLGQVNEELERLIQVGVVLVVDPHSLPKTPPQQHNTYSFTVRRRPDAGPTAAA